LNNYRLLILFSGGDIPFDVVIYATGFKVVRNKFGIRLYLERQLTVSLQDEYPLSIRGINGQTIQDYFKSKAGPQAYMGTNVPGFPNFYMILGMIYTMSARYSPYKASRP
jgi:hypothetical protein